MENVSSKCAIIYSPYAYIYVVALRKIIAYQNKSIWPSIFLANRHATLLKSLSFSRRHKVKQQLKQSCFPFPLL